MANGSGFVLYRYTPSLAAATAFTVLFWLVTIVHLYQLIRARTWYFIPFVIGGFCEAIGYIGRIQAANEAPTYTRGPYIQQSLLILIGPAFFAASIYMVLGRIIRLVDGERHAIIRSTWLTKIFVGSDVLCFLLQGAGGSILATAKTLSAWKTGENIIIGGLFVQLIGFGTFLLVAGLFHYRTVRDPTPASASATVPWRRFLFALYAASSLILIRSLFRVVEFLMGYSSPLQDQEYWLYIFDAAVMFVCMAVLAVFHPGSIVSGRRPAATAADKGGESGVSTAASEVELRGPMRGADLEARFDGPLPQRDYYK